jgi:hypothetical protein
MLGIKTKFKRALNELKRGRELARNPQLAFAQPGHFYSPFPNLETAHAHVPDQLAGINLNERRQLALLETFAPYHQDIPFSDDGRYSYKNPFFGHGDAVMLYCMMRHYNPRRIIEVGSGYSSAAMLDTRERLVRDVELTFIEPFPVRLKKLARSDDIFQLIEKPVQDVALTAFTALRKDDILFIDSSHVTKFGSDVNYLFFHVLPSLSSGVVIHLHDIGYPFEYPREWLENGRAWNEAYLLRAFLQYNSAFEILYWNAIMGVRNADAIGTYLPVMLEEIGGSIWLTKL